MSVQDQPGNLSVREASPHEVAGLGIALSLAGLYFMLGSLGVLPMPDADGPAFLVFAAGAAFLFAGLLTAAGRGALLLCGTAGSKSGSERPPESG